MPKMLQKTLGCYPFVLIRILIKHFASFLLRIPERFLTTKWIAFLLLLALSQADAKGFAQEITLSGKNIPFEQVISVIKKQTGFAVSYTKDLLKSGRPVTVTATKMPLAKFLNQVLQNQPFTFKIMEENIALIVKEPKPERVFNSITATQSSRTVRIKVIDTLGRAMSGATIAISNKATSIVSNSDGYAEVDVKAGDIVTISYVGYKPSVKVISQEIINKGELNVSLQVAENEMDNLIVIGYGTVRKSDLTGSVATFKDDKVDQKAHTSVQQMLQGQIAGVQITQNTGAPGGGISFSIRGATSISGSNEPLIVIDGVPVDGGSDMVTSGLEGSYGGSNPGNNALASLNPGDIESIEVLKDASSTAIYGSRGANGVVLITTKTGKAGKERISYSYRTDFSQIRKKYRVLNTQDYMAYANEAEQDKNNGSVAYFNSDVESRAGINFDWQDLIYQTGRSQNHSVNLSGGNAKLKYAIMGSYLANDGIVKNSFFRRGTFRFNLDRVVSDRLDFGLNVNGTLSTNRAAMQSTGSVDLGSSVVLAALKTRPLNMAFDDNGDILIDDLFTNPLNLIYKVADVNKKNMVTASLFANYKIVDGLTFRAKGAITNTGGLRNYYMPRGTFLGNQRGGYAYEGNSKSLNYLNEFTFNYNKTFGSHRITAVAGYTYQKWNTQVTGISASNFPNDNLTYYNLASAEIVDKPSNAYSEWGLSSFLARVNYALNGKYLITATARNDGSTRLAEGHKWALFPSIGLGWNAHNESFMKRIGWVSELKLRTSYGVSGNQSVSVGSTKAFYTTGTAVVNQTVTTSYTLGNMPNSLLGWENTSQFNTGVDLGILRGRFQFTADLFYKKTENLLINLTLPLSTGYTTYTTNAGDIENKGLELSLSAKILTGKLKWTSSGNISFIRNKILSFDGNVSQFLGPGIRSMNGQPANIAQVGAPIGAFYGYRINGIYQTQDEINKSPVDPASPRPGDFKFADISGPNGVPDGLISSYDAGVIGNPYPKYYFGFTNDFNWKGFSLNVLIQGSIGQQVLNTNRFLLDGLSTASPSNITYEAFVNRWTGPGTSNTYPAARSLVLPFMGRVTDFIVEDASFVRLKTVTLSYNLPGKKLRFLSNASVFVSGVNLITLTRYKGYDPEISSQGDNALTPGLDNGSIPQFRTISAGINVGF